MGRKSARDSEMPQRHDETYETNTRIHIAGGFAGDRGSWAVAGHGDH
jgi:hypothetical protein